MTNSEVARRWIHQNGVYSESSTRNFYFSGKTIYSYGAHFPIATLIDENTIIFTTRDYSNTTCKHKYCVWNAIYSYQREHNMSFKIFRENSPFAGVAIQENSKKKIECILEYMGKIIKARGLMSSYVSTCKALAHEFVDYCTFFERKPDRFFYNVLWGLDNLKGKTLKRWCAAIKKQANALGLH